MCRKIMTVVMNRVPVARHRLILGEDEATTSRKLFKPQKKIQGEGGGGERKKYLCPSRLSAEAGLLGMKQLSRLMALQLSLSCVLMDLLEMSLQRSIQPSSEARQCWAQGSPLKGK